MINLILFGPPGSGKGTQAAKLVEQYNLMHISTGDLFRFEMGNDTPLGKEAKSYISKGELVPDSVTIGMLKNKVNANPDVPGFIFDGFPRTVNQAEALDEFLDSKNEKVTALISMGVDEKELISRLLERGKTSGRKDDSDVSIIQNRLEVYNSETTPVYDFYNEKMMARKVDGQGTIAQIFKRLCAVIDEVSTATS